MFIHCDSRIFFTDCIFTTLSLRCHRRPFTDPYEEKLFSLFASHENGSGFLDLSGLNSLIQTLQLKERGSLLISLLLKNGTRSKVTFNEFREGLLQVITSEDDGIEKQFFWHFGGGLVMSLPLLSVVIFVRLCVTLEFAQCTLLYLGFSGATQSKLGGCWM